MHTTQLDNGILNNYAVEPQVTYTDFPTLWEQKNYVKQGAVAALFVSVLFLISFAVS